MKRLQLYTRSLAMFSAMLVGLFGLTTGAGAASLNVAPKNIELQKTLAEDAEAVLKVGHRYRRHWRGHRRLRHRRHRYRSNRYRYYDDYPYRYRYGYKRHRHYRKHRRHRRLKRHIRRFLRHQLRHW